MEYLKFSGSGNDFIIIDNMNQSLKIEDIVPYVSKICARGISVGADGVIILEPSKEAGIDFVFNIYNADGSVAEMCGNGARCAARLAYLGGYADRKMKFSTLAGVIKAEIRAGVNVKVQMTTPTGLVIDKNEKLTDVYDKYSFINTGVPHTVIFDDDLENVDISTQGKLIRNHGIFAPAGTNVDFVKVINKNELSVRTYERGVEGETLACGTGAVASALVAINKQLVVSPVTVHPTGKVALKVYVENDSVYLEGEARLLSKGALCEEGMKY